MTIYDCEVTELSVTLLDQIMEAEAKADQIRAEAQKEAREIIKSVGEANQAMERQTAREMHDRAQRKLDEARTSVQDEIKALELRRASEREALKRTAQARVSQGAQAVFERVVNNGSR